MKSLLLILGILGLVAAGCGRETTSPEPQRPAWETLRYQQAAGGTDGSGLDLSVLPVGALTLRFAVSDSGGNEASSRGLLAGEKLETLTRLVGALPPLSYAPSAPCASGGWSVTLVRQGEVRTYASCADDPDAPASVRDLGAWLRAAAEAFFSDAQPVQHRQVICQTLLIGTSSRIHDARRLVLRDRDALARLLREHSPDQPAAVPRVDFSRQMVVAEFLGDRPVAGYFEEPAKQELTDDGHLLVSFDYAECAVAGAVMQPFLLAAVDRHGEDVVFTRSTKVVNCR